VKKEISDSASCLNIYNIKQQIMNTPEKQYTLDSLSSSAGFSKYYFTKLFKNLVGQSPFDYLNTCRIIKAKKTLIYTDKNIKDIYVSCGFNDEAYFFKTFKILVGITPLEYRKKYNLYF
jgi:AraC-like DNA-binding protein